MSRKKPNDVLSAFSIRISNELRKSIEETAEKEGRSVNNLINMILKNHFNKAVKQ